MKRVVASEESALQLAEPYLLKLCRDHWKYIEFDDRLSELQYLFICAWRQLPTNTGHFLKDFEQAVTPYMDQLNRAAAVRFFKLRSFDGAIKNDPSRFEPKKFTFHSVIQSKDDHTQAVVDDFLSRQSKRERDILRSLLDGRSKASIAREHGLSLYRLNRLLEALGNTYLKEYKTTN